MSLPPREIRKPIATKKEFSTTRHFGTACLRINPIPSVIAIKCRFFSQKVALLMLFSLKRVDELLMPPPLWRISVRLKNLIMVCLLTEKRQNAVYKALADKELAATVSIPRRLDN
ncbi:hypothetical protein [Yersinia pseudotuberculosis]|uniref:hypothetical protein n=1 Tax=Yersinia pseudotuberculosis TaxID=633 RepID=UPI0018C2DDA1|nr:hypothetical protein [Yersinia pseudotuberculosis]